MKTNELINSYFLRKKSQYGVSMRSLALKLDISPSFFSRMLSGKKPIPYSMLVKLKPVLDIDDEIFETIKSTYSIYNQETLKISEIKKRTNQVTTQLAEWNLSEAGTNSILRDWFFLPILEFTTLKKFDGSPESISKGLGLGLETVNIALRELKSLGLIEEKQSGLWKKSKKKLRWSSSTSKQEIRRFHKLMMNKAQAHLDLTEQKDFESRLITGITLTVSPKKIKEAKKRLNEFLHDLANELIDEEDLSSEVYHLGLQFFPLSK